MEFFRTHPSYQAIAQRCGTAYLARTTNKILMHHIRDCIPQLKGKVNALMSETQSTLSALGNPMIDSADKGAVLLQMITKFSMAYTSAIEGTSRDIAVDELFGGARICYIFHDIFGRTLEAVDPLEGLTINDIRTAIRNATGTRQALFVPEISFELLVKRQIRRLEDPSLRCAELVFEELIRIISQCENREFSRFRALHEKIMVTVTALLKKRLEPSMTMIENLVKIELAYINTSHPDFTGGSTAVAQMLEAKMRERQNNFNHALANAANSHHDDHELLGGARGARADSVGASGSAGAGAGAGTGAGAAGTVPGATADGHHGGVGAGAGSGVSAGSGGAAGGASAGGDDHEGQRAGLFGYLFGGRGRAGGAAATAAPAGTGPAGEAQAPGTPMALLQSPQVMRYDEQDQLSPRERMETELIQSLIRSYFNIVRKNIQDAVPKTIMCFLVNWVRDNLQSELVSQIYRHEHFDSLLKESEHVAEQRAEATKMLDVLKQASAILAEVRDANF